MNEQRLRPGLFEVPTEGQPAVLAASGPHQEDDRKVEATPDAEPAVGPGEVPLVEPTLLDLPEGMTDGRVDHGWAPGLLQPRAAPSSSLSWIAVGVAMLLVGWLVLSAIGFVSDQFARSAALGWTTVLVFGGGLLALLWGLWREVQSFRQLQQVDTLRALLLRDDAPVTHARTLALEWLGSLHELPNLATTREVVATAPDVPLLRAALRRHLAGPLHAATRTAGTRAALEGATVVAISPSPALDGVLAGLRGLSLLRQVAAIHGMRPGAAVTLALLRRLAWTAAGTSGIDLLGQGLADSALSHWPGVKHIAAVLPGSGLTAIRLKRLADVAAQACSPIGNAG